MANQLLNILQGLIALFLGVLVTVLLTNILEPVEDMFEATSTVLVGITLAKWLIIMLVLVIIPYYYATRTDTVANENPNKFSLANPIQKVAKASKKVLKTLTGQGEQE